MYNRRYGAVVPYSRGGRRRTNYLQKKRYPLYRRLVKNVAFAKKVRLAVGAELKYFASNLTFSVSQFTSGAMDISSIIVEGLTPKERIGNWIQPVGVHGTV